MAPGELLYHVQTQPLKLGLAFAKLCNDHGHDAKNELLMSTKQWQYCYEVVAGLS